MKFSKLLIPTQKEAPSDVDTESQKLMIRAGMLKKVSSGLFVHLPYMKMMMLKVENIIREEMNAIGANECKFPILVPKELLDDSGRWGTFGNEMFRLKDRAEKEYAISPTNEEYAVEVGKSFVRSYKDLPLCVYQINAKHRDEIRPRGGVVRSREFTMKDAYSFHTDEKDLVNYYAEMRKAYVSIFKRLGLDAYPVKADNGVMGGLGSEEFMVVSDEGQAEVAFCEKCGKAWNLETVECFEKESKGSNDIKGKFEKILTPHTSTIEQLTTSLKISAENFVKSMVYVSGKKIFVVLVRGDREVNEIKVKKLFGLSDLDLASEEDIKKIGSVIGFVGPIGLSKEATIVADFEIKAMKNFVIGANEKDFHLKNVNNGDFVSVFADVRTATHGDICPTCGKPLLIKKGNELGHVFSLGERYSKKMGANFIDSDGKAKPMQMGCYGIGLERTVAAIVENCHDEKGLVLPVSVAPFAVDVVVVDKNKQNQVEVAQEIYDSLTKQGVSVVVDDRDERAGFKFVDSELLGIPVRITAGKTLEEGKVEITTRKTGEKFLVKVSSCNKFVLELLKNI